METNSKSDVKAKEAYVKVLAEEGFKDIEIISTPTDISASKNGTKYFFELKFTNQTEKYFGAATLTEWECAINNLENQIAHGYVLDLRSNPGGLLEASIEIARLWLDEGVIVSTETRDGIKDIRRANGKALTNRPVVVLVDNGSPCASLL